MAPLDAYPESLKPEIHKELDRLVRDDIIRPVAETTAWVNSLYVIRFRPQGSEQMCQETILLHTYHRRSFTRSPWS